MSKYVVTKKTELEGVEISMCSDGIIRVLFKRKAEINSTVFKEVFRNYNELVQGKNTPLCGRRLGNGNQRWTGICEERGELISKNLQRCYRKVFSAQTFSELLF